MNVTVDTLDDVMEFDHVIQVHADGTVTEPHDVYAPWVVVETDADGQILNEHETDMRDHVRSQGWELETGWTGQCGYNGPIMHPSEYIGGGLAEHILETPGYWVALVVELDDESGTDVAGWAVAYREA